MTVPQVLCNFHWAEAVKELEYWNLHLALFIARAWMLLLWVVCVEKFHRPMDPSTASEPGQPLQVIQVVNLE